MMGFGGIAPPMPTGGSFLGVEQKKRLIWGGKKVQLPAILSQSSSISPAQSVCLSVGLAEPVSLTV